MTSTDRLARVVLSHACEPGDPASASLLDQLGAERAVEAQAVAKPNSALDRRIAEVDPVRVLAQAREHGIRFVTPEDPEWPADLSGLNEIAHLGMGGQPPGLWVRGPASLQHLAQSVAIVGARASTVYGDQLAADIAATVATAGYTVVSGGALGIDAAAHRGALAAGAGTVAVLARGLDGVYPQANAPMLWEIARDHALVSEQAPGSLPTRLRFLARNRLIVALTIGTVLVEAATRSGALNTAAWAEELSRPVMGVPGPVTSAASAGVHDRIRSGGATMVTCGAEVLELLGGHGQYLVPVQRGPERRHDALSKADQRVFEAVPAGEPAPITEIAHEVAGHARDVDRALCRLRELGLVRLLEAGWVVTSG